MICFSCIEGTNPDTYQAAQYLYYSNTKGCFDRIKILRHCILFLCVRLVNRHWRLGYQGEEGLVAKLQVITQHNMA